MQVLDFGLGKLFCTDRPDRQRLLVTLGLVVCNVVPAGSIAAQTRSESILQRNEIDRVPPVSKFEKFSVGVNIGKVNVLPATQVRGKIDGAGAIEFSQWLVSYQDLVEGLKFKLKILPDNQIEVRTPSLVTRLDLKQLQIDPDLGLVLSIADLDRLFGIKAEFDMAEYAIVLTPPWGNNQRSGGDPATTPASKILGVAGLPRITPPPVALSGIQQRITLAGGSKSIGNARGDLVGIGTLWGYSGYLQVNQSDLFNAQTWKLGQIQLAKQTDREDWTIGSQSPFWRTQSSGEYWGVTTVVRDGFQPIPPTGILNPLRLQATEFGNTIVGEAPAGTLVRLTQGFGDRAIAEVLVDSSKTYRFENIKGSNYRLLLYPNGQLTALPEVRDLILNQTFGQIPVGTAATIWSGGIGRTTDSSNFWGNFSDLRVGVAQRWGVSEQLTVGLGGVYDRGFQGLGELFWRPQSVPLQVGVSGLIGSKVDLNSTIDYQPTPNFNANLAIDRVSTRLRTNWQISRNYSVAATYDPRDVATVRAQYIANSQDSDTFASVSLDTASRWRSSLQQRWGLFQLSHQADEQQTQVQASYDLVPNLRSQGGSSIVSTYENRALQPQQSSQLANLVWRYQSPARAPDGPNLWQTELGYGVGTAGTGLFASAGIAVVPGLMLRGRYQGVTNHGIGDSFAVELVSNFNTLGGIQLGDRRMEMLRSLGGITFQPFFDRNANGIQDPGEESYLDNLDLLIAINARSIDSFRPERAGDRVNVKLLPGTYRIDLDPAGYPIDWQIDSDSLGVDVVAGTYTSVMMPLIMSFARSGVVSDPSGQPLVGAKIEAINLDRPFRRLSISNTNGLYNLENLSIGKYRLEINGKFAGLLNLTLSSPRQQSLQLRIDD